MEKAQPIKLARVCLHVAHILRASSFLDTWILYVSSFGACSVPPTAISRTSLSDINKTLFYVSLYAEFIMLNTYLIDAYTQITNCRLKQVKTHITS